MTTGLQWEENSKVALKQAINRRVRSIIGVSLEALEDFSDEIDGGSGKAAFEIVRGRIMKVCNDIARKLCDDLDGYTIKRNRFEYKLPYKGE